MENTMTTNEKALALHEKLNGKLETVSITQKKLDSLRKEWEELRATDPQMSSLPEDKESKKTDETEEELNVAYPFGSWVDENNYK